MKNNNNLSLLDESTSQKNLEEIKQSILDSASAAAAKIIDNAKAEAHKLFQQARADIDAQREENKIKAQKRAEEIITRRDMLSKLSSKQFELEKKQELVAKVYKKVQENFLNLPKEEYQNFFLEKAAAIADDGDLILLSEGEEFLDKSWLKKLIEKCGKKLSFADEHHSDIGGIVLRGENFDKNLTLSVLIKQVREKTEDEIVKRLFL